MKNAVLVASALSAAVIFSGPQLLAQSPWPPDDPDMISSSPSPGYAQQGYGAPQNYPQQSYGDAPAPGGYGQQQSYSAPLQSQQPLHPDQLEQLLAPIALYPDSLLAQILAAATYPAQISAADRWLRGMGNASPDQIAAGADMQTSWDPSVKALTAFPQVLSMLDQNLQWTTTLGNAYYNQPQDVLQTVQVMRQRAEQAGNLESTPQENVVQNQGYISLAPANPDVLYVPSYNPWAVYGQPVSPYPGFSLFGALGSFFGSSPVHYGLSFALSAFNHTPFGLLSWGLDWLANAVLFHNSNYFTHSNTVADWGFPHGGPRFGRGGPARAGFDNGYHHQPILVHSGVHSGQAFRHNADYPYARSDRSFDHAQEGFNRGYYGETYPRQQAYNRAPVVPVRPQPLPRRSESFIGGTEPYRAQPSAPNSPRMGYGAYPRAGEAYGGRPGMAFASRSQGYRAPESAYSRGEFGRQPSRAFGGNSGHSGGFHLFGGGHNSESFSGGGHAPKSFGYGGHAPKKFGGGHASHQSHSSGSHSHGGGHGHFH